MKKIVVLVAVVFAITATSCKKDHKHGPDTHEHAEGSEKHAEHDEKAEIAMADAYQCPMDCEKGKTYDKEGTCPTCKMNLKKVEEKKEEKDNDTDHDESKEHDHDGDKHSH